MEGQRCVWPKTRLETPHLKSKSFLPRSVHARDNRRSFWTSTCCLVAPVLLLFGTTNGPTGDSKQSQNIVWVFCFLPTSTEACVGVITPGKEPCLGPGQDGSSL